MRGHTKVVRFLFSSLENIVRWYTLDQQKSLMSANAEKILKEALSLPPLERAEVLERLLATFQDPPDPELDKLWAQEAEDRLAAYDRNELGSVSEEEVFARIERQRGK